MQSRFLLIPFATLAIVSPASATVYMSIEQAQKLMFPGATLMPEFRELSREQASAVEKASGVSVRNRTLRLDRRLVHRRRSRGQARIHSLRARA
jgi:hypothetical protein